MARSFNGTSDAIDCANESLFDLERTDSWSMVAWTYSTSTAIGVILGKQLRTGTRPGYIWYQSNSGADVTYNCEIRGDASPTARIIKGTSAAYAINAWHRVGWTYDGSSAASGVKFYVNGTEPATSVTQDNLGTNSILNNVEFQIGCAGGAGNRQIFFPGRLARAHVWKGVVLTLTEIEAALRGAVIRPDKYLGWWELFGVSSPEPDWSGGGSHGTLAGTAQVDHPPGISADWLAPNPKRFWSISEVAPPVAVRRRLLVGVGI